MKICASPEQLRKTARTCDIDVTKYCEEFKEFVKTHSCMSMTAPQVGTNYAIMAVKYRRPTRVYILVNPAIKAQGKKMVQSVERTLDTHAPVSLKKQRPVWVILTYMTPNLKHKKQRLFVGRRAAAALHAYEILQGTLR